MRDFLDGILEFIGAELLTDEEFESINIDFAMEYTKDSYSALKTVLTARDSVSSDLVKLKAFFNAKGVGITTSAKIPASNILIGRALW